ncbi:hypothetical protein Goe16_00380 [Bacillus phage vB_BsuM-Goe16]|nr:hypothetical protein Goe16_00380 [Bacillus phage vB_BsuM-Goe16]
MILDTNKLYSCAKELRPLVTEEQAFTRARELLQDVPDQSEVRWDEFQEQAHRTKDKEHSLTTELLSLWDNNHRLNTLMTDGMCFIRYVMQGGVKGVLLTPVLKNRLDIVRRHLGIESDIPEDILQHNIEHVRDWEAWGEYIEEINELTRQKCIEYTTGSALEHFKTLSQKEEPKEEEDVQAGIHAVERYIERVLGITEPSSIKHESVHRFVEYKEKIETMYRKADVLYEIKDKVYKITKDNIILAYKGNDNKIMTLYKKDYGFTKEINRKIIFMQLEVIKNEKAKLDDIDKAYRDQMAVYCKEEKQYKAEVEELQEKLDRANAKLSQVMRCKRSARSMMEESERKYQEEYNKVFKTCKVVQIDE